jgi:uncharacterized protein YndB with AHSA1/START domain
MGLHGVTNRVICASLDRGYQRCGEYTEVVPFRRVVFTWGWSSAQPDLAALRPGTSLVEIELEPRDGGTQLRLRHSRLPEGLQPIHAERWSVHLSRLAVLLKDRASEASRPEGRSAAARLLWVSKHTAG